MVKLLLDKGANVKDESQFEENIMFPAEFHFLIMKYLLKRGANPKVTDGFGNTLLHLLCDRGNLKDLKYIIKHYNVDVNAKNKKGQTLLHRACDYSIILQSFKHFPKIVKYLIEEENADPAVTCNDGKTALHYAAKNDNPIILRYLIEDLKLDITATDNEGRTILHVACEKDHKFFFKWETQKYLIEEHPKIIEAKDKTGKTALHYCLENFEKENKLNSNQFEPIALILKTKAKILETQENNKTDHISDWIKQSCDNDMKKSEEDEAVSCLVAGLKMFQNQLDISCEMKIESNPVLYIAYYCNRVDIAEFLFNQDCCYIAKHFNAKDANSKRMLLLKSYLEFSCKNGLLDLTSFLIQEIKNKQELFKHFNFDGHFLKTACRNKHFDLFKYLLKDEKARDEAAEFLEDFPLHYACSYGSKDMVQYLFETNEIDIELKDKEGQTPLHLTCYAGSIEIAKYLSENKNANMDTTDNKGRSVWHFACQTRCFELVKYISQKTKLNVNFQDEVGSTALHLACEQMGNLKVVKFLITDMKANPNIVDKEEKTPLHAACQCKWPKESILNILVDHGANVLAKDISGKTPLQIAKAEHSLSIELIEFLKNAIKRL
jgi:ankyrin repeat protein